MGKHITKAVGNVFAEARYLEAKIRFLMRCL